MLLRTHGFRTPSRNRRIQAHHLWIAVIAVLMVAGALTYLYLFSTLDANTVIATTLGVFFWSFSGVGCSPPPSSATKAATTRTSQTLPSQSATSIRP